MFTFAVEPIQKRMLRKLEALSYLHQSNKMDFVLGDVFIKNNLIEDCTYNKYWIFWN